MTSLILHKISIPEGSPHVSRRRLTERLDRSLVDCNFTVIHGRAGAGKTLLATEFAPQCNRPVAWFKVDASDSDPAVFSRYLSASIARHHPGFGGGLAEEATDVRRLAECFAHELDQTVAPILIVLDDLHLIHDAGWLAPFLSRVWLTLPAHAHLMMIGRIAPPIPLWRMRSKQKLCVVDEAALSFSLTETALLLESYGLPPSAAFEVLRESGGRASRLDATVRRMLGAVRSADVSGRIRPQEAFS